MNTRFILAAVVAAGLSLFTIASGLANGGSDQLSPKVPTAGDPSPTPVAAASPSPTPLATPKP